MSQIKTKYIADNQITNAKLAQIATQTFKGRTTAATGNVEDLTVTQATAMLNVMVGDSGAGGTKGLVPAPGSGDFAAGKFLNAGAAYSVPFTSGLRTPNTQSGTTYTLALTDGSKTGFDPIVYFTSASAVTVTVPLNATIAFPVNTQIDLVQLGAGAVTFVGAGGVTLTSQSGSFSIYGQYSGVSLLKTATDTWTIIGNTNATSSAGTVVGPWTPTTLTLTASFGGAPAQQFFRRQVGDSYEYCGTLNTGTTTGGNNAYLQLESGVIMDTSKMSTLANGHEVGKWTQLVTSGSAATTPGTGTGGSCFFDGTTNNQVFFTNQVQSNGFVKRTTNAILLTGDSATFRFTVPVVGLAATANSNFPRTEIVLDTGNGYGSTNTAVRRFSNIRLNNGTNLTLTQSSTLGDFITCNVAGVYHIMAQDYDGGAGWQSGITVNGATLTSNAGALTYAQGKRASYFGASTQYNGNSVPVILAVGDVIRVQGNATGTTDNTILHVTQTSM